MRLISRTFYVPASATDAYEEWKARIHVNPDDRKDHECALVRDVPGKELEWLSRWGVAQIDTKADFIPAQGGCVVHLNINGIGKFSRLILATVHPLTLGPWSNRAASHSFEHASGKPVSSA